MKRIVSVLVITLLVGLAGFADIPRPTPEKSTSKMTPMDIRLDADAKEAKLQIPRSPIKQLRAELEQLDSEGDTATGTTATGFSRTQTIVSGLFLSLAIIFGGMWFVSAGRGASKVSKGAVAAIVVVGFASAAGYVYANAGPPSEARSITGKMFSQALHYYNYGTGQVKIEVSPDDRIRLIVPNPK